jgi:hypothetical protein
LYRAWDTTAQEFVKIAGRYARWNMAYGERYDDNEDGASGQDRDSYSDDQDRDSYSVEN